MRGRHAERRAKVVLDTAARLEAEAGDQHRPAAAAGAAEDAAARAAGAAVVNA